MGDLKVRHSIAPFGKMAAPPTARVTLLEKTAVATAGGLGIGLSIAAYRGRGYAGYSAFFGGTAGVGALSFFGIRELLIRNERSEMESSIFAGSVTGTAVGRFISRTREGAILGIVSGFVLGYIAQHVIDAHESERTVRLLRAKVIQKYGYDPLDPDSVRPAVPAAAGAASLPNTPRRPPTAAERQEAALEQRAMSSSRSGSRVSWPKWLPIRRLSDEEYQRMLEEKILAVEYKLEQFAADEAEKNARDPKNST
eukprot:Opistho-2@37712